MLLYIIYSYLTSGPVSYDRVHFLRESRLERLEFLVTRNSQAIFFFFFFFFFFFLLARLEEGVRFEM